MCVMCISSKCTIVLTYASHMQIHIHTLADSPAADNEYVYTKRKAAVASSLSIV